jgi:hypothetical protein
MRKVLVGVAVAAAAVTAPALATAQPTPNWNNCVGVADSGGARAGGFGQVVSGIATSGSGAIAASLEAFVTANRSRSGPGQ